MKVLTTARAVIAFAIVSSAAISCSKTSNSNTSPTSPQNEATGTALMNATNAVFFSESVDNENQSDALDLKGGDSSSCRTITFIPSKNVYPNQKTVDFGAGCTGPDGITRKGEKIIMDYENPDSAKAGDKLWQTTFSDFYEDSIKVEGTITVYQKSWMPLTYEYVENITLTSSNGDVKTSSGIFDWTKVSGLATSTRDDDTFHITGSSKGAEILDGATSFTFTTSINSINPVVKPMGCYFRTAGEDDITIKLITGGGGTFSEVLNYGDGTCDNWATLSINGGEPQQVQLPLRFWPLSL